MEQSNLFEGVIKKIVNKAQDHAMKRDHGFEFGDINLHGWNHFHEAGTCRKEATLPCDECGEHKPTHGAFRVIHGDQPDLMFRDFCDTCLPKYTKKSEAIEEGKHVTVNVTVKQPAKKAAAKPKPKPKKKEKPPEKAPDFRHQFAGSPKPGEAEPDFQKLDGKEDWKVRTQRGSAVGYHPERKKGSCKHVGIRVFNAHSYGLLNYCPQTGTMRVDGIKTRKSGEVTMDGTSRGGYSKYEREVVKEVKRLSKHKGVKKLTSKARYGVDARKQYMFNGKGVMRQLGLGKFDKKSHSFYGNLDQPKKAVKKKSKKLTEAGDFPVNTFFHDHAKCHKKFGRTLEHHPLCFVCIAGNDSAMPKRKPEPHQKATHVTSSPNGVDNHWCDAHFDILHKAITSMGDKVHTTSDPTNRSGVDEDDSGLFHGFRIGGCDVCSHPMAQTRQNKVNDKWHCHLCQLTAVGNPRWTHDLEQKRKKAANESHDPFTDHEPCEHVGNDAGKKWHCDAHYGDKGALTQHSMGCVWHHGVNPEGSEERPGAAVPECEAHIKHIHGGYDSWTSRSGYDMKAKPKKKKAGVNVARKSGVDEEFYAFKHDQCSCNPRHVGECEAGSACDRSDRTTTLHHITRENRSGFKPDKLVCVQCLVDLAGDKSRSVDLGTRRSGVDESDYRGLHKAPGPDAAPFHDVTQTYPDDFYGPNGHNYYSRGSGPKSEEAHAMVVRYKGKPEANIKVFRAVPHDDAISDIHPGDWVTHNRAYAKQHGLGFAKHKILSKVVKAKELYTDGNSVHEWGYHPEKVNEARGPDEHDGPERRKSARYDHSVPVHHQSETPGERLVRAVAKKTNTPMHHESDCTYVNDETYHKHITKQPIVEPKSGAVAGALIRQKNNDRPVCTHLEPHASPERTQRYTNRISDCTCAKAKSRKKPHEHIVIRNKTFTAALTRCPNRHYTSVDYVSKRSSHADARKHLAAVLHHAKHEIQTRSNYTYSDAAHRSTKHMLTRIGGKPNKKRLATRIYAGKHQLDKLKLESQGTYVDNKEDFERINDWTHGDYTGECASCHTDYTVDGKCGRCRAQSGSMPLKLHSMYSNKHNAETFVCDSCYRHRFLGAVSVAKKSGVDEAPHEWKHDHSACTPDRDDDIRCGHCGMPSDHFIWRDTGDGQELCDQHFATYDVKEFDPSRGPDSKNLRSVDTSRRSGVDENYYTHGECEAVLNKSKKKCNFNSAGGMYDPKTGRKMPSCKAKATHVTDMSFFGRPFVGDNKYTHWCDSHFYGHEPEPNVANKSGVDESQDGTHWRHDHSSIDCGGSGSYCHTCGHEGDDDNHNHSFFMYNGRQGQRNSHVTMCEGCFNNGGHKWTGWKGHPIYSWGTPSMQHKSENKPVNVAKKSGVDEAAIKCSAGCGRNSSEIQGLGFDGHCCRRCKQEPPLQGYL